MSKIEINHVISLGSFCHTAYFIKSNNLRTAAYPFDWIYSTPKIIIDCIRTQFKNFLNKDLYINNSTKPDNSAGHALYGNKMFYHKNPRNQIDYEYYVRCINKFNDILKKTNSKLFIIIQYLKSYNLSEIVKLDNELYGITNNYKLLVINIDTNKKISINEKIVYDRKRIMVINFPAEKSKGSAFENDEDNKKINQLVFSLFEFKLIESIEKDNKLYN
jgi:hypothetical protein